MPPTKATLPDMVSPVAALRGDVLQRTFAHRVGISRMALLRLEQGLLPEPSLKLLPYLPDTMEWSEFVSDYHAYQVAKRQANYGVLTDEPSFNPEKGIHPFVEWIDQSSETATHLTLTAVCVSLCLHLPTMHRFVISGPYPVLPPDLLLDSLNDAGYSKQVISDFVMSYAEWYNG